MCVWHTQPIPIELRSLIFVSWFWFLVFSAPVSLPDSVFWFCVLVLLDHWFHLCCNSVTFVFVNCCLLYFLFYCVLSVSGDFVSLCYLSALIPNVSHLWLITLPASSVQFSRSCLETCLSLDFFFISCKPEISVGVIIKNSQTALEPLPWNSANNRDSLWLVTLQN